MHPILVFKNSLELYDFHPERVPERLDTVYDMHIG